MQKVASGQTRMAMRACCVPVVLITVITVYAQKIELDCTVHMYILLSTYSTCSECSTEVII
jgi:hypothetical protein